MNTAVARRLVIITCMLAILALAPLAASQGPAAPAQSGEEVVDIVYFGKKKPILLRLHYSIDGKTLRRACAMNTSRNGFAISTSMRTA